MGDKIILRYAVCTLSDRLYLSHVFAIPRLVSMVLALDAHSQFVSELVTNLLVLL